MADGSGNLPLPSQAYHGLSYYLRHIQDHCLKIGNVCQGPFFQRFYIALQNQGFWGALNQIWKQWSSLKVARGTQNAMPWHVQNNHSTARNWLIIITTIFQCETALFLFINTVHFGLRSKNSLSPARGIHRVGCGLDWCRDNFDNVPWMHSLICNWQYHEGIKMWRLIGIVFGYCGVILDPWISPHIRRWVE